MRSATVVLPVPGLPVKLMCSVGGSWARPSAARARSTSSSAAISRMRRLDRRQADQLAVELVQHRADAGRFEVLAEVELGLARRSGPIVGLQHRPLERSASPHGSGEAVLRQGIGAGTSLLRGWQLTVAPAGRSHGARWCSGSAAVHLLPLEPEARLLLRAVDDEGQPHRFPAMRGVEGDHPDVAVAVDLAAVVELHHHAGRVRMSNIGWPHISQ